MPPLPDPATFEAVFFILYDQLDLTILPPPHPRLLLIVVESLAYATALPHHQKKLTLILSAQRHWAIAATKAGYAVLPLFTLGTHAQGIAEFLTPYPHLSLTYFTPSEWDVRQQMRSLLQTLPNSITECPNPLFIAEPKAFVDKISKGYRLETFYRDLRRSTGYLMDGAKPVGGQWNYDKDNRKSLPPRQPIPPLPSMDPDVITQEVMHLVATYLPHHFGSTDGFGYAVTRSQALELADYFFQERLPLFGAYEDAMKWGEPFLFHSVLSPYLNLGLLSPRELCQRAIAAYENGSAPLNSVEGFLRQILGWREFIRVYYEAQMPTVRTANHFGFSHPLPTAYWTAQSDLRCLQDALQNVLHYGYSHHIQRLMVLSNFSNLTFTNPLELNHWFWLAYIDAHEWVELPNVLGMATYADGGILASKPYVSGGNYIHKMGNYCQSCSYQIKEKTGDRACPFNYLYWNFVDRHRQAFDENGRVSLMTRKFDEKTPAEQQAIRNSAEKFITNLPRGLAK
ncbi:MAG: cryptochrome/photolyase family protein [Oscillatoriales cyanobacterium SM2_2_1]|nr:cryptochrome/photolyase family protein [Oscillatoriales cyanobacterium SM2_2_1]